jgi:hypothetical protein
MKNKDINEILKDILGTEAINDNNIQISENTSKLVKTINYLITQLEIIKREFNPECDNSYLMEHIDSVINNTKEILSENK